LEDLKRDEQTILESLRYMRRRYNIAPGAILLTGFSAGGYPMYYTGLRNPTEFSALVARACNSQTSIFEQVNVTENVRQLPVIILHGKDEFSPIGKQSWAAFRWLRQQRCFRTEHHKIRGGHMRQPEAAWRCWQRYMPEYLRDRNR
ncbi:MAG: hypothetical protein HQ546_02390, partial [Planctomycetes bacterium]|nr:hypothetical protein [Planctomycetota bacterium]